MDAASAVPDRYTLVSPLGHGAMGTVWRAHDRVLQRDVAVKVVTLAGPGAPGSASRFQREAQAAATIDDPHVVRVLDAGHLDRTAWLVMELLPGPSLADLVEARGPLPWGEGIALAAGIARGIAAAHAAGIVHRDIKPGNIVLRGDDAVIVDFGIARLAQGDATRTATGVIAGTAAYLAPEQARGEVVTPATDLYSFGCLLMTMFTGASPFSGEHAVAQAYAHVNTPAPRLSERRPDAPAALDALVARLLEKDPDRRPDAPTVVAELDRLGDDPSTPSGLPPEDPTARLTSLDALLEGQSAASPRRAAPTPGRWPRILPVLALVAVLAAVVVFLLLPDRTPPVSAPGASAPASGGTAARTAAPTASATTDPGGTPTVGSASDSPAATGSEAPPPTQAPTTASAPTSTPATPASGPTTIRPAATVPAQVLAGVRNAIQDVANPGARGQLQRVWTQASEGITVDNADARVATVITALGTMPQVTDAERTTLLAALDRVRAA